MVPPEFYSYFTAAAAAGGALIGLLFVAVSVAPHRTVHASASVEARVMLSGAFTALVNGFFVSLGAALPYWNIGMLAVGMSLLGVVNSLSHGWLLLKPWPSWNKVVRRALLTLVSLYLYIYELVIALHVIASPTHSNVLNLGILILGIYGLALVRAWGLLGVQRTGLLSWLNPLDDGNSDKA